MGKRRHYRFPQSINQADKLFHPFLHPHPQASPNDIKGAGYFDTSVTQYGSNMYSDTDVLGSYTGIARNGEMPVQDADDL